MKKIFFILCLAVNSSYAQSVSISSFGAAGDGITDDGPALQNALSSGNIEVKLVPGRVYRSGQNLIIPTGVTLDGNGATIQPLQLLPPSKVPFISTQVKSTFSNPHTSITVTKGSHTFTFENASKLRRGKIVLLKGPQYYFNKGGESYNYGWYSVVTGVEGNEVTLQDAAGADFTATAVQVFQTAEDAHITNLHLDMRGQTGGFGLGLLHAVNSSIENCFVESDAGTGLTIGIQVQGINCYVSHATVKNIKTNVKAAYGINVEGHDVAVQYCKVSGAKTCISSPGRTYLSDNIRFMYDTVSNEGGGAGIPLDFHGNASGLVDGCVVTAFPPNEIAISIRGGNTVVQNNTINFNNNTGAHIRAVWVFECAQENVLIQNNRFILYGNGGNNSVLDNSKNQLAPTRNLVFRDNIVKGGNITLHAPVGDGLIIAHNYFEDTTGYNAYVNIASSALQDYRIDSNTFVNNAGTKFNYAINTPKAATRAGSIAYNTVYVQNSANNNVPLRINNSGNAVHDNVIYSNSSKDIQDNSGDGNNKISNNKKLQRRFTPPGLEAAVGPRPSSRTTPPKKLKKKGNS